jgi:hypothetical protein
MLLVIDNKNIVKNLSPMQSGSLWCDSNSEWDSQASIVSAQLTRTSPAPDDHRRAVTCCRQSEICGLALEHDPEKSAAVFRKDHAQLKN